MTYGTAYSRPSYVAVSTTGGRKLSSGKRSRGSGRIQPAAANSEVQSTSMLRTSNRPRSPPRRSVVICACVSSAESGSSTRVTFSPGWVRFQPWSSGPR